MPSHIVSDGVIGGWGISTNVSFVMSWWGCVAAGRQSESVSATLNRKNRWRSVVKGEGHEKAVHG